MMKTEKLYYIDSHLTAFSARVLRCDSLEDGRFAVVLDRTAFFPEGGGQSADPGMARMASAVLGPIFLPRSMMV